MMATLDRLVGVQMANGSFNDDIYGCKLFKSSIFKTLMLLNIFMDKNNFFFITSTKCLIFFLNKCKYINSSASYSLMLIRFRCQSGADLKTFFDHTQCWE